MPNWNHIVRERLVVLRLPPERESEIVEEVVLHLEAIYDEARAVVFSENEAEARAAQSYRGQEKEFHHEEHKDHEEGEKNLLFSGFCTSSLLRVLRFFVVLFS